MSDISDKSLKLLKEIKGAENDTEAIKRQMEADKFTLDDLKLIVREFQNVDKNEVGNSQFKMAKDDLLAETRAEEAKLKDLLNETKKSTSYQFRN